MTRGTPPTQRTNPFLLRIQPRVRRGEGGKIQLPPPPTSGTLNTILLPLVLLFLRFDLIWHDLMQHHLRLIRWDRARVAFRPVVRKGTTRRIDTSTRRWRERGE
jgi:hypothetical protein